MTRRQFCTGLGSLVAPVAFGGACVIEGQPQGPDDGRLVARPHEGTATTARGGAGLGLDPARDAFLQVPARTTGALPLLVLLHGAGQSADFMLDRAGAAGEKAGVALLVPNSRDGTWDAIRGGYGRDVAFLNRALERVFQTVAVDPARVAIGGFSDGATYALSLGLVNGDLFRRVVAFSPGFIVDGTAHGQPRFFVSHGTGDRILPIDRCSRRIVPGLRTRGYDVTFREFPGGHEIPDGIADEALKWVAS